mgnify:CR=1 FL=1
MVHDASLASLSPIVLVHLTLASAAVLLGPAALWARKGSRGHRGLGYAWVTVMVGTALTVIATAYGLWQGWWMAALWLMAALACAMPRAEAA